MRLLISVVCTWAFGASLLAALPGCGKDSGGGSVTEFDAGDTVVLFEGEPFPDCDSELEQATAQNEPWISIDPNNRDHIVAMWQTRWARGFVAAVTFDGGATWETSIIPGISRCTGGEARVSDPWLAFSTNGDLYSVALNHPDEETKTSRILVNKSLDGGLTWSDPVTVGQADEPFAEDKPSISADPFDECIVYVGWNRFDDLSLVPNSPGEVFFSRTTDCGETWSEPQGLYRTRPSGIGFQTVVLPDGDVLAFFRETNFSIAQARTLYMLRSTDQGVTWSDEPVEVAVIRQTVPRTPDGEEPIRSSSNLFDVAVDRSTGRLVAVWEQFFGEGIVGESQVAFTQSDDGGLTWTEAVRIDQTPESPTATLNQAFVPVVEISDDGTIGVTYYNFENDTPDMLPSETDNWFIHCHPDLADCTDPASWADPVRVTKESFDISKAIASSRGLFLGDYMGLTSFGSDFFTAFTVTLPSETQNIVFAPILGR
ncbi:MAG: sialidase family protein [Polyangiales bacterium]